MAIHFLLLRVQCKNNSVEAQNMMSIGEWLALALNRLFPPLQMHLELRFAKTDIEANHRWAYEEAQRICPYFGPYWEIKKKLVLDIGTGLGGKLPFYIESGARTVIGIDINEQCVKLAKEFIQSMDLSKVVFLLVADAAALPFSDNIFDAIVSINTFEHIERVEEALHESYRVLKPDGISFVFLPPYYSPWGPHLELWIHFPWPHLIFSERTLMKVVAREESRLCLSAKFIGADSNQRIWDAPWIPYVNRLTFMRFHRMVLQAGFSIKKVTLLPVGYKALSSRSLIKQAILSSLKIMTSIPFLQEVVITKMAYVIQKPAQR
jgi:SAM-dependent methyltransferase